MKREREREEYWRLEDAHAKAEKENRDFGFDFDEIRVSDSCVDDSEL